MPSRSHHLFLSFLFVLAAGLVFSGATEDSAGISVGVNTRNPHCNDGLDNDGDFLIDYSNDNWCSSTADDDENVTGAEVHATKDFTISGGTFSFNNGDSLAVDFLFPANFYTGSVRLFANSYANSFFSVSKPATGDRVFVGKTYDFLLYVISSGSELASADRATTITLRYQNSDVTGSTSENTIAPYKWGNSDSSWQLISGATLDAGANSVQFSTTSFGGTSFALFGTPPAAVGEEVVAPAVPRGGDFFHRIISFLPFIPKTKPEAPERVCASADFNCDGNVNLRDLSILLYFWDKPMDIAAPYDLSQDGKIEIRDASILLYYWTG